MDLSKNDWVNLLKNPTIFYESNIEMILYVYSQPNHQSTATEIGMAMGNVSQQKVTGINKSVAMRIYKKYGKEAPPNDKGGKRLWTCIFDGDIKKPYTGSGYFIWRIKHNLLLAIEEMIEKKELSCASENSDFEILDECLYEGTVSIKTVKTYGRNALAKKKCLDYYGDRCQICNIDFNKVYGENFMSIINVHHIEPIHDKGERHKVIPEKDLIPVCPNCHAALHSKTPPYSPKELLNCMEEAKKKFKIQNIVI